LTKKAKLDLGDTVVLREGDCGTGLVGRNSKSQMRKVDQAFQGIQAKNKKKKRNSRNKPASGRGHHRDEGGGWPGKRKKKWASYKVVGEAYNAKGEFVWGNNLIKRKGVWGGRGCVQ